MKKQKFFEVRLDYSKNINELIKASRIECELIFENGERNLFLRRLYRNEISNLFYKGAKENLVRKNKTQSVLNALDKKIFDFEGSRQSKAVIKIKFVPISKIIPRGTISVSPHQVLSKIKRRGLQIAGMKEIIALGAAYPGLQKEFPLTGLDYFLDEGDFSSFIIETDLCCIENKNLICIRSFDGFSRDSMLPIIVPE